MVNFKSALVAAVGAASLGFAVVAGAQSSDAAPKLVVQYSPSSLSTDNGVRHLYARLVLAAEKVCEVPRVGPFPTSAELACRRQAVDGAVVQIHNPRLAEISAAHSHNG